MLIGAGISFRAFAFIPIKARLCIARRRLTSRRRLAALTSILALVFPLIFSFAFAFALFFTFTFAFQLFTSPGGAVMAIGTFRAFSTAPMLEPLSAVSRLSLAVKHGKSFVVSAPLEIVATLFAPFIFKVLAYE